MIGGSAIHEAGIHPPDHGDMGGAAVFCSCRALLFDVKIAKRTENQVEMDTCNISQTLHVWNICRSVGVVWGSM